jgi:hypothetical protein
MPRLPILPTRPIVASGPRLLRQLLLFLPVVALLLALEAGVRQVPTTFTEKARRFRAGQPRWRTLVLGSSHTYFGLNPDILGAEGFNLAYSSQSLYYDQALLRQALPQLPALRRVIIPISYPSLTATLAADNPESWRAYLYHRYWGIDLPAVRSPFSPFSYSLVALFTPATSWAACWQHWQQGNPELPALHPNGWFEHPDSGAPGPAQVQLTLQRHHLVMHQGNYPATTAQLDSMLALLHQRGISIVLLTTPVHRLYAARIDPAIWRRNQAIIHRLGARYGARYYNYFTDPRFRDSDFWDADHLNGTGARRLSALLRDTLAATPAGPPR